LFSTSCRNIAGGSTLGLNSDLSWCALDGGPEGDFCTLMTPTERLQMKQIEQSIKIEKLTKFAITAHPVMVLRHKAQNGQSPSMG
jgi:hypothetical protein